MSAPSLMDALADATKRAIDMDAPLGERLKLIADTVSSLSDVFAGAVDSFVGRLKSAGAGEFAPKRGERRAPFVVPNEQGKVVGLDSLLAKGPAAIVFLRGHWCPYCQLTAAALTQVQSRIAGTGGTVVVITPEILPFTRALRDQSQAAFPTLIDMDNGYAMSINLVIWVDESMSGLIASAGWDVPKYQGNSSWMLPIPASFVVNPRGEIVARFVDPDYRKRMDLDELVNALRGARG